MQGTRAVSRDSKKPAGFLELPVRHTWGVLACWSSRSCPPWPVLCRELPTFIHLQLPTQTCPRASEGKPRYPLTDRQHLCSVASEESLRYKGLATNLWKSMRPPETAVFSWTVTCGQCCANRVFVTVAYYKALQVSSRLWAKAYFASAS